MNITEKTGNLVGILSVDNDNDLMIINKSGILIRLDISTLRVMGRATQGVRLIKLTKNDTIASIAKVEKVEDEEQEEAEGTEGSENTQITEDQTAQKKAQIVQRLELFSMNLLEKIKILAEKKEPWYPKLFFCSVG